MIVKTFMPIYKVEYYLRNLMCAHLSTDGPYNLDLCANDMEGAVLSTLNHFHKIVFTSTYSDVWNATIKNPEGEDWEILRKGSWLVDFGTGKRLSDLEKKISNKKQ